MSIDKYLRVSQVCEYTGLSRATIYSMEKSEEFPRKIALGKRAVAWLESDVCKWMESRKTVTKVGREAKPGRLVAKPVKAKATIAKIENSSGLQAPSATLALNTQTPTCTSENIDDIWADDGSSSSSSIDETISVLVKEMRQRANKARKSQGDIVKRTHRVINLDARKPVRK